MPDNKLFAEIKSEYEFLTKVEKKLADLILSDPQKFIGFSMTELSTVAGVSQGSINNFAKKFSSGGYSALKLQIAACLSNYKNKPFTVTDKEQRLKSALEFKIEEMATAFRCTLDINSEEALQKAVKQILGAKKIEIYGVFSSGIVANDFCYKLIQLGIPVTFVTDSLMCLVSASMLTSDDLVIAISSSGRTKEVIEAVNVAQKNNVPVMAITSHKSSPIASLADNTLLAVPSNIAISDRGSEIRMSMLLLIDAICSYIQSKMDKDGEEQYYKVSEILNSHYIQD